MGSRVLWLTEQREKRDENDEDIEDDEAAIPVSIQQLGLGLGLGFWKRGEGACLSVYSKSSVALYLWRGSLFSTGFGFFMFFSLEI